MTFLNNLNTGGRHGERCTRRPNHSAYCGDWKPCLKNMRGKRDSHRCQEQDVLWRRRMLDWTSGIRALIQYTLLKGLRECGKRIVAVREVKRERESWREFIKRSGEMGIEENSKREMVKWVISFNGYTAVLWICCYSKKVLPWLCILSLRCRMYLSDWFPNGRDPWSARHQLVLSCTNALRLRWGKNMWTDRLYWIAEWIKIVVKGYVTSVFTPHV